MAYMAYQLEERSGCNDLLSSFLIVLSQGGGEAITGTVPQETEETMSLECQCVETESCDLFVLYQAIFGEIKERLDPRERISSVRFVLYDDANCLVMS